MRSYVLSVVSAVLFAAAPAAAGLAERAALEAAATSGQLESRVWLSLEPIDLARSTIKGHGYLVDQVCLRPATYILIARGGPAGVYRDTDAARTTPLAFVAIAANSDSDSEAFTVDEFTCVHIQRAHRVRLYRLLVEVDW